MPITAIVDCAWARARLVAYLDGTLEWSQMLVLAYHLEACAGCAEQLALVRSTARPVLGEDGRMRWIVSDA